MEFYRKFGKRAIDLSASTAGVILLSWLFILVYLSYFTTGLSSPLFVQVRVGLQEKRFRLYKFRTLIKDESLPLTERRFKLGSMLRRTSLDELPQLFNVIKGDMSLIGPRPLPPEYLPLYTNEERRRHSVRPGITGWAQVNGRHSISWQQKFSYDLYYVERYSPLFDLRIFLRTLKLLFSFSKDRSLEEKRFTGRA